MSRRARKGEAKKHFEAHVLDQTDECVLWPYATTQGYGVCWLDGRVRRVSAAACERWHGPRPVGMDAAHSCGNRLCFNGAHLRWATRRENCADTISHGRTLRGEDRPNSILTEADVLEVCRLRARGLTYREIAEIVGVSFDSVRNIITGRTWSWLTGVAS